MIHGYSRADACRLTPFNDKDYACANFIYLTPTHDRAGCSSERWSSYAILANNIHNINVNQSSPVQTSRDQCRPVQTSPVRFNPEFLLDCSINFRIPDVVFIVLESSFSSLSCFIEVKASISYLSFRILRLVVSVIHLGITRYCVCV